MILILAAQLDLGMTQKSIGQSPDWIGSRLIEKSYSMFKAEPGKSAEHFEEQICAPNLQISTLKWTVFPDFVPKGP